MPEADQTTSHSAVGKVPTALRLPFPQAKSDNGDIVVNEIDLSTMRNAQLLELIKRWDLKPKSRNRSSYITALETFSADRSAWVMIFTPAITRKHKGPRTDQTSSSRRRVKSSTIRRQQLLGLEEGLKWVAPTTTTEVRSKDTRTQAQITGLIDWAHRLSKTCEPSSACSNLNPTPADILHNAVPTSDRGSLSHNAQISSANIRSAQRNHYASKASPVVQSNLIGELARHTEQLNSLLSSICDQRVMPTTPLTASIISHGASTETSQINTNTSPNTPESRIYTLQLANECIYYTAADIPDPPAISFVHDLARLFRIWDDKSPDWDKSSPLRILGKSIALVYWPTVYRYQGTKQWSGVKQRWFEWKSLVMDYRALGSDAFWSKYSRNGDSLPISKVLDKMKISRMQEDVRIAEMAKQHYGGEFAQHFSYRVTGSSARRLLVRPDAIARRFRSLRGSALVIPASSDVPQACYNRFPKYFCKVVTSAGNSVRP